jgi:hypothetical protein
MRGMPSHMQACWHICSEQWSLLYVCRLADIYVQNSGACCMYWFLCPCGIFSWHICSEQWSLLYVLGFVPLWNLQLTYMFRTVELVVCTGVCALVEFTADIYVQNSEACCMYRGLCPCGIYTVKRLRCLLHYAAAAKHVVIFCCFLNCVDNIRWNSVRCRGYAGSRII